MSGVRCTSAHEGQHLGSKGDDVVDVILAGIDDWVAAQVPLVGSGRAATAVQRRGAASPEGGDAGGDARVSGVRCTPPRKGDILGGESSEEGCQERHPGSGASSERVGWKRAGTQDRQGASLWLEQRKGHGPWGARWDGGEAEQGDMAAGFRHWGGRWELQQDEGSERLRDRATTAEAEECKMAVGSWRHRYGGWQLRGCEARVATEVNRGKGGSGGLDRYCGSDAGGQPRAARCCGAAVVVAGERAALGSGSRGVSEAGVAAARLLRGVRRGAMVAATGLKRGVQSRGLRGGGGSGESAQQGAGESYAGLQRAARGATMWVVQRGAAVMADRGL